MLITRIGLSSFTIEVGQGQTLLIDPWLVNNPSAVREYLEPAHLGQVGAVVISHGHSDHASGVDLIQKANPGALVYAPFELSFMLMKDGITNVQGLNVGGTARWGSTAITLVPATHSSSYGPNSLYAGPACGVVITLASGFRVYYAGDTSLSAELKLIGDYWKPDLAILPCGGVLTMDAEQAVYAAVELVRAPRVIPCHYFPTVENAPDRDAMAALVGSAPFIGEMIEQGTVFRDLMAKRSPNTEVTVLDLAEAAEFPG